MKKAVFILIAIVAAVLIVGIFINAPANAAPPPATVWIDAPNEVNGGGYFSAWVRIYGVTNFSEATYYLTWDPNDIRIASHSNGQINGTPIQDVYWKLDNSAGTVEVTNNASGVSGVNGSGYLIEINYQVVGSICGASGIGFFNLSGCTLSDIVGGDIPAEWTNASVHIGIPLPTPSISPSPSISPTPSVSPTSTSAPTPKYNLTVNQSLSCCNVSVVGYGNVAAGDTTTYTNISSGTVINVSATYNGSCNAWNNWTGGVNNDSNPSTSVTMSMNRSITANCANVSAFTLTVSQASSCCNVTVSGTGFNTSTVVAGTATTFTNISPGKVLNVVASYNTTCNTWSNWIGEVANASAMSTTITMVNFNKSITASCTYVAPTTPKYNLTVNQSSSCCNVTVSGHANASGTVVAGSSNTFSYIPQNTELTVVAVFNGSCNYFSGWTGGVLNTSAMNTKVNMSANRTITAGCTNESLYRLTVNQSSSCCNVTVTGRGTVAAGTSNSWDIIAGTIVNVSASNNSSCNRWNNWTGGVLNVSAMSTAVNMTANRTITAGCTYVPPVPPATPTYSLTVNQTSSCCNVSVSGHVNASGNVIAGATTTFSNIPSGTVIRVNASYNGSCDTWGNWSGSVANISAMNTTVTMSASRSITANCTYSGGPTSSGGTPSWLWPVVGVMIFLTLALFGYAANRAGWIGKPKGWFGGGMEEYTADGFGEEDVYDKLYGETGGIEKGTGGGSDMTDDEL